MVTARTKECGGRNHPISWGYRPDLKFEADDEWCYGAGFVHNQDHNDFAISPGETREFEFYIRVEAAAAEIMPKLTIGSRFTMNEGSRPVADCVVTKIY